MLIVLHAVLKTVARVCGLLPGLSRRIRSPFRTVGPSVALVEVVGSIWGCIGQLEVPGCCNHEVDVSTAECGECLSMSGLVPGTYCTEYTV